MVIILDEGGGHLLGDCDLIPSFMLMRLFPEWEKSVPIWRGGKWIYRREVDTNENYGTFYVKIFRSFATLYSFGYFIIVYIMDRAPLTLIRDGLDKLSTVLLFIVLSVTDKVWQLSSEKYGTIFYCIVCHIAAESGNIINLLQLNFCKCFDLYR